MCVVECHRCITLPAHAVLTRPMVFSSCHQLAVMGPELEQANGLVGRGVTVNTVQSLKATIGQHESAALTQDLRYRQMQSQVAAQERTIVHLRADVEARDRQLASVNKRVAALQRVFERVVAAKEAERSATAATARRAAAQAAKQRQRLEATLRAKGFVRACTNTFMRQPHTTDCMVCCLPCFVLLQELTALSQTLHSKQLEAIERPLTAPQRGGGATSDAAVLARANARCVSILARLGYRKVGGPDEAGGAINARLHRIERWVQGAVGQLGEGGARSVGEDTIAPLHVEEEAQVQPKMHTQKCT